MRLKRRGFNTWVGKIPWRRKCSPLQYSCLENPMVRGAWWAAVHRVTQSRTQCSNLARTHMFISVQSLSHVRLFATPWTAAHQASLSITNFRNLLKLMSIELVMPSNHLILCCPLLLLPSIFPSIRSFPMSQFFTSGGQSIGVSASVSVLPMNIQD